jgi:Holliday junction DNA helicase RuvA
VITYLQGKLVEKHPTRVVIDVQGVGYEVLIPLSSFDKLPAVNEPCRVLTYDYVREDTHTLFGFADEVERDLFTRLLSITGIGPKLALSALSGLSPRDFKAAVVEGDVKRLTSISGIGKKVAERIVVELRDKLSEGEAMEAVAGMGEPSEEDTKARDAAMALISLGYKQADAWKMVRATLKSADKASVEDIVRRSLVR